jgi:hypothetical protein
MDSRYFLYNVVTLQHNDNVMIIDNKDTTYLQVTVYTTKTQHIYNKSLYLQQRHNISTTSHCILQSITQVI